MVNNSVSHLNTNHNVGWAWLEITTLQNRKERGRLHANIFIGRTKKWSCWGVESAPTRAYVGVTWSPHLTRVTEIHDSIPGQPLQTCTSYYEMPGKFSMNTVNKLNFLGNQIYENLPVKGTNQAVTSLGHQGGKEFSESCPKFLNYV